MLISIKKISLFGIEKKKLFHFLIYGMKYKLFKNIENNA